MLYQTTEEQIEKLTNAFVQLVGRVTELELKVSELEAKADRSKAFKAPSEEDVMNHAIGLGIDTYKAAELGQKFCSFYESKGWMIGKNKMKNWRSAVQTWLRSGEYNTVNNSETLKSKWL